MEKTVCIDWLSFTAHEDPGARGYRLPPWESGVGAKADTPRFGYRRAERLDSGTVVMFDGTTPTMGQHYIHSGATLKLLDGVFQDGGTHVLNWHNERGHKCTRIDLAIDVFDAPTLLPVLKYMSEAHGWTGTAHSATTIKSSDGKGITIYIGSRVSERFVRIYDKAAQTRQEGDWTRIECEVKGDSARAICRAILGAGDGGIGLVAQSVISRVCEFDTAPWHAIFDGKKIQIGTPKVEEKQTEAWLLGQVVSAITRFERDFPEKKILEKICRAVEGRLFED